MSPQFQTLSTLLVVAAAAAWLVARSVARRRKPGCGGDCGCASEDLRERARSQEKAAGTRV